MMASAPPLPLDLMSGEGEGEGLEEMLMCIAEQEMF